MARPRTRRAGTPGSATTERRRGGFTLIELVVVLSLIGVVAGIAVQNYNDYLDRTVPERAAVALGGYVALTRSYALQLRRSVTLNVDPSGPRIVVQSESDTFANVVFDDDADFEVSSLSTNLTGDSLTFNGRGLCAVCGVAGKGITVASRGTSYVVSFNSIGRWKTTPQE